MKTMTEEVASSSTSIAMIEDVAVDKHGIEIEREPGGTFKCSFCTLIERYDYKGAKPPFAKDISYQEDCYIMKDPFSMPKKGQVLIIGGDCCICNQSCCLGCSIFYAKRFCQKCALDNITNFPRQLQSKIKNFAKDTT